MALLDLLIQPPRLPRAVPRPRVSKAVLRAGVEPGRLLIAPSGSGKTVAATQALHAAGTDSRTGWCRLAPGASGGADLVELVVRALGAPIDDVGMGTLQRAAVILEAIGDHPTTLVIDDYDLGRPEECDAVLAEVLALVGPDCRIVVCSAARPAGLVGRASVGDLRVVGPVDLTFTEQEVADLLVLLGHDPSAAAELRAASGGWATAVAMLSEAGTRLGTDGPTTAAAVDLLLDQARLGEMDATGDSARLDVLAALALLPSVGATELAAAGVAPALVEDLAQGTALLRPIGDRWALLDAVREPLRRRLGPDRQQAVALRLAPVLAVSDPVAAAGALLDAGVGDEAAADILARHASEVTADAVVPLLYRMRPEVRRRLPPLLSEARATVEMDAALAEAELRLARAADARERVEAQVAVGAMLVHRGQLSSACTVLESALRAPRFVAVQAAAAAVGWLALARLWAGDLDGAAATLAPVPTAGRPRGTNDLVEVALGAHLPLQTSPIALWVGAEIALAQGDLATADAGVHRVRGAGWDCAADAVEAQLALARGASEDAAVTAGRAYQVAVTHGGFDLLVAGPVHAWCLARSGRWDEAAAVAEVLRRRLGTVDTCARLQADLIAEACARVAGDQVAVVRHGRAVAATRRLGYAPVEATARRWLGESDNRTNPPAASGLRVELLGPVVLRVEGQAVADGAWRSRKAREVLLLVALAGTSGSSRDEVVEAVWPDREPDRGRTLLRTALAEIRRVLEPARQPGEASRYVSTRGDRLAITGSLDAAEAERHWTESDLAGLVAAWRLFRGPPVADEPYTASLEEFRRRAERLQLDVAHALVSATSSEPGSEPGSDVVVAAAEHVLAAEPWRTELAQEVARACRARGDDMAAARIERLLGSSGPPQ
ncbi:MAG TPA: hypothetical protein VGJ86_23880 [Acidimicrobiales bacterium]